MQVTVAQMRAGPHGTTLARQPGSGAADNASYLYNFVQSRALEAAEGGCQHFAAVARLLCQGVARAHAVQAGVENHMGARSLLEAGLDLNEATAYCCWDSIGRGLAFLQQKIVAPSRCAI
jgi:hypothetical protein